MAAILSHETPNWKIRYIKMATERVADEKFLTLTDGQPAIIAATMNQTSETETLTP